MSAYTIGEAAERSGFSASALRYYEGIGLVEPANRTEAGYRLYDDETLARLAFIARAKQLGCNLEEITDLVAIWDGERCGPVQRRFHELLTTKIADAQRQIDELTSLVGQLRDAAAHLAGPATDGPCSTACACMAIGATAGPVALTSSDATTPIACTASSDEVAVRIDQVERLRGYLTRLERGEHGLLLHFPNRPDIDADVRIFTVDEKRCCAFWAFAVTANGDELTLRWDGPPDVSDFFDRLFEFFDSDQPLTALDGLI